MPAGGPTTQQAEVTRGVMNMLQQNGYGHVDERQVLNLVAYALDHFNTAGPAIQYVYNQAIRQGYATQGGGGGGGGGGNRGGTGQPPGDPGSSSGSGSGGSSSGGS